MDEQPPQAASATIEGQGLAAWFQMDFAAVAACVQANAAITSARSARAAFLIEALQLEADPERYRQLHLEFRTDQDLEGQYAAAGAGVLAIWNSGADLKRYGEWSEEIERLLSRKQEVVPLAVASLLGFKGMMQMTGANDLSSAARTYEECLQWCEKSESISLWVFQASMLSYCYLWKGELSRAEILLADTAPLAGSEKTGVLPAIYFELTRALLFALQGKAAVAKEALRNVSGHPAIGAMPPFVSLFGYGHLLFAVSQQGNTDEAEEIAEKIRRLAIPERNHFHHSYVHFCLAIVCNLMGLPAKGLLHGEKAVEIGRKSHSPIAERMPALVVGQSLADLGEYRRAIEYLSEWIGRWQLAGYDYFAASAAVEISAVLIKLGETDRARSFFEKAESFMPRGERAPHLLRPPAFAEHIKRRLFDQPAAGEAAGRRQDFPVDIHTFGDLRIRLGTKQIYDRNWFGTRTKSLLKALIVLGAEKVPMDRLADMLWPDSDADDASNNLKIAVSRLRRLGADRKTQGVPWIVVRHRRISLPRNLRFVDCLEFQDALQTAVAAKDFERLACALELYRGDFLAGDTTESWVVRHREALRDRFVRGVIAFTQMCLDSASPERALTYLEQALELDPTNEDLYAWSMESHLRMGSPSKAVRTFNHASTVLRRELGTDPGQGLLDRYRRALAHG